MLHKCCKKHHKANLTYCILKKKSFDIFTFLISQNYLKLKIVFPDHDWLWALQVLWLFECWLGRHWAVGWLMGMSPTRICTILSQCALSLALSHSTTAPGKFSCGFKSEAHELHLSDLSGKAACTNANSKNNMMSFEFYGVLVFWVLRIVHFEALWVVLYSRSYAAMCVGRSQLMECYTCWRIRQCAYHSFDFERSVRETCCRKSIRSRTTPAAMEKGNVRCGAQQRFLCKWHCFLNTLTWIYHTRHYRFCVYAVFISWVKLWTPTACRLRLEHNGISDVDALVERAQAFRCTCFRILFHKILF